MIPFSCVEMIDDCYFFHSIHYLGLQKMVGFHIIVCLEIFYVELVLFVATRFLLGLLYVYFCISFDFLRILDLCSWIRCFSFF
jgi:hypothetical protein